jgi:hypothetical protein
MHGGVAGVGGQPPPLCRSSRIIVQAVFAPISTSLVTALIGP